MKNKYVYGLIALLVFVSIGAAHQDTNHGERTAEQIKNNHLQLLKEYDTDNDQTIDFQETLQAIDDKNDNELTNYESQIITTAQSRGITWSSDPEDSSGLRNFQDVETGPEEDSWGVFEFINYSIDSNGFLQAEVRYSGGSDQILDLTGLEGTKTSQMTLPYGDLTPGDDSGRPEGVRYETDVDQTFSFRLHLTEFSGEACIIGSNENSCVDISDQVQSWEERVRQNTFEIEEKGSRNGRFYYEINTEGSSVYGSQKPSIRQFGSNGYTGPGVGPSNFNPPSYTPNSPTILNVTYMTHGGSISIPKHLVSRSEVCLYNYGVKIPNSCISKNLESIDFNSDNLVAGETTEISYSVSGKPSKYEIRTTSILQGDYEYHETLTPENKEGEVTVDVPESVENLQAWLYAPDAVPSQGLDKGLIFGRDAKTVDSQDQEMSNGQDRKEEESQEKTIEELVGELEGRTNFNGRNAELIFYWRPNWDFSDECEENYHALNEETGECERYVGRSTTIANIIETSDSAEEARAPQEEWNTIVTIYERLDASSNNQDREDSTDSNRAGSEQSTPETESRLELYSTSVTSNMGERVINERTVEVSPMSQAFLTSASVSNEGDQETGVTVAVKQDGSSILEKSSKVQSNQGTTFEFDIPRQDIEFSQGTATIKFQVVGTELSETKTLRLNEPEYEGQQVELGQKITVQQGDSLTFENSQLNIGELEDNPFLSVETGNGRLGTVTFEEGNLAGLRFQDGTRYVQGCSYNIESETAEIIISETENIKCEETREESESDSISIRTESGIEVRQEIEIGINVPENIEQRYQVVINSPSNQNIFRSTYSQTEKTVTFTPEQTGEYTVKILPQALGGNLPFVGNLLQGGSLAETTITVSPPDQAQWKTYCAEQNYQAEQLSQQINCIEEEIIPEYFEDSTGSNPEVAESLCQDLLGYNYNIEQSSCVNS